MSDSLISCRGLDIDGLIRRFLRWYRESRDSVGGRCFDIEARTRVALESFERTGGTAASDPHDLKQADDGPPTRLAPVAIFAASDAAMAGHLAERQSRTTHTTRVAHDYCRLFVTLLVEAIAGVGRERVLASRFSLGRLVPVAAGDWSFKRRGGIASFSHAVATLEAALWCVERTSSFEEAGILAVDLGGGGGNVGAVAGQLAGALYSRGGIPQRWLNCIARREDIQARAAALWEVGRARG